MVLGNLKGLIDLNDKEIATLRLTASLAMTGIFRQPECVTQYLFSLNSFHSRQDNIHNHLCHLVQSLV